MCFIEQLVTYADRLLMLRFLGRRAMVQAAVLPLAAGNCLQIACLFCLFQVVREA